MRNRPSLVLLSLLALAACEAGQAATSSPAPSAAPRATLPPRAPRLPPTVRWQGHTAATIVPDGPDSWQTSAALSLRFDAGTGDVPLIMRIELTRLPPGTTMAGGGVTAVESHGVGQLEIPVADVGAIPIAALDRPVTLALGNPIEIALPGQEAVTTTVPAGEVDLRFDLMDALELVRRGPVRFGAEANRLDTAAIIGQSILHEVVGDGATLADIDWVVDVARRETPRRKRCSGYNGGVGTVTIRFLDAVLTIYDLRTGKQVGVEVISPPARCPYVVRPQGGEDTQFVAQHDITRRVARRLAAGNGRRAR